MNLLESMMYPCALLVNVPVNDPMGGFMSRWVEGATFNAFIRKEDTPEITVGEKTTVEERLIIVVPKDTPLEYHSVVKRESDGEVYRVTSTLKDFQTPMASSIQVARADIERWTLV